MNRLVSKLPWLATAAYLLVSAAWLATDPRPWREGFPAYSSFSTGPEGLSLAYKYLDQSGSAARVLQRTVAHHPLEPDAVLLRIAPGKTPGSRDQAGCGDGG